MPQHREVSPKDLGLTAEDQEMMRLGDVFQDPEKKKPTDSAGAEEDNVQFEGDVHPDNFPDKKLRQPEEADGDVDSNGPGFVYRDKKKS